MKFTELVDLVLLAVNGGAFTSEGAVMRPDVEAFAPAAAHAAMRESVFQSYADARQERNSIGFSGATLGPDYYRTYELTVAKDEDRDMHYADLPGFIQDWPGDRGLSVVFAKKNPQVMFNKISGPGQYASMADLAEALNLYWHESAEDATTTRLWLPGIDSVPCTIMARAAIQLSPDLGDVDVSIPSGVQEMTIQKAIAHFRGQREMPQDTALDNKDVNAPAQTPAMIGKV